jgi:hypothetical protein
MLRFMTNDDPQAGVSKVAVVSKMSFANQRRRW